MAAALHLGLWDIVWHQLLTYTSVDAAVIGIVLGILYLNMDKSNKVRACFHFVAAVAADAARYQVQASLPKPAARHGPAVGRSRRSLQHVISAITAGHSGPERPDILHFDWSV